MGCKMKYGCHNRAPFNNFYHATGSVKEIRHVMTMACQYTKTELGKTDQKCDGCKHKEPK